MPDEIVHPCGTDEIVAAVGRARAARRPARVVGSGHSFTDCACTDGTLIELDRHRRLLAVDRARLQVTVQAGIVLSDLNDTLARIGMALPNLGDIEYQTLAGALATGTHGTGARLGCLATAVIGVELVTAAGSVLELSASSDPSAFAAAQVSVGALGVVSALTLQCVPAFNLHAVEEILRFDDVLERFDELADGNDHFEFYWMPGRRSAVVKRNNRVEGPERPRSGGKEWMDDVFFPNVVFGTVGRLRLQRPWLARALTRALPKPGAVDYVERSDRVFTSPRRVRFREMEYGFPRASAGEVLRELRSWYASSGLNVGFPIEVRVSAPDDIPLSMTSGRESAFVACHVFRERPCEEYFRGVERIMRAVDGRPHWGKLHYQDAASLAPLYPQWDLFGDVRRRLDPSGVFANAYTDRVFGPVSPPS